MAAPTVPWSLPAFTTDKKCHRNNISVLFPADVAKVAVQIMLMLQITNDNDKVTIGIVSN